MVESTRPALPDNIVELVNATRGGLTELLGLRFVSVTYDEITAEVPVTPHLFQPYGLVHGGVYTAVIETLASVGAALYVMAEGRHAVGLENTTSFLRAVRTGTLHARAVPLTRGKRTHVWEVLVTDDTGQSVATGRVRILCVAGHTTVAGETVSLKTGPLAR
ncbi:MAG: PaaI family thioesterase [Myxococcota bacterium]